MTTTPAPEKPVRRTAGRSVPPVEARPLPPPPPAPPSVPQRDPTPARSAGRGKGRRAGGIPSTEADAPVDAYQRLAGAGAGAPPPPPPARPASAGAASAAEPDADTAGEPQRRAYPTFTRSQSRVIDAPDARLIDPIKKPLEQIARRCGVRPYQFYADWLEVVEFTLKQLPGHLAHAKATGTSQPFAPGTPQADIDRWLALFARYGSKDTQAFVYQQFAEAFARLLDAVTVGIFDFVGHVYQELELTEKAYAAQYWTPMSVAFMMAQILNPAHSVYERIYAALTHPDNILGHALLLASSLFALTPREGQEAEDAPVVEELAAGVGDFFFERLLPAALPYYEPLTINEPCVGSGVMLLAAAAAMPPWMTELGLVQFTGMDTDALCVRMASINCMLYGLNGYAIRCWEAGQDAETLAILNDPARIAEAQAIRTQLAAEREARHAEEAEERAARAALTPADLDLVVETTDGTKRKRLTDKRGATQMELF